MTVQIVRLGGDRIKNEGIRIGTVRRPPRGVPRSGLRSRKSIGQRWPSLRTIVYWNCWPPCPIKQTSLWVVTARKNRIAIVRF